MTTTHDQDCSTVRGGACDCMYWYQNEDPKHGSTDLPLHDHADQRAVLDVKPLRGLRVVHEGMGLYVIVRERDNAPDNYEIIAENLTQSHAEQICACVNMVNGRAE